MREVEQRYEQFCARYRDQGSADPGEFLAGLQGAERTELEALIEHYLLQLPPREWDPAELADSPVAQMAQSLSHEILTEAVAPDLIELRNQAQISRQELVEQLAVALEVPGARDTVAARYHRMERGLLDLSRISSRVFEQLAEVTGNAVDAVRAVARNSVQPGAGGEAGPAFARLVTEVQMQDGALFDAESATTPGPGTAAEPDPVGVESERARAERYFDGG